MPNMATKSAINWQSGEEKENGGSVNICGNQPHSLHCSGDTPAQEQKGNKKLIGAHFGHNISV